VRTLRQVCAEGAIAMTRKPNPLYFPEKCTYCGIVSRSARPGPGKPRKRIHGPDRREWGRRPLIGTLYATFLPEEKVVEFITAVLAWYREKAEDWAGSGWGDIIIREGTDSFAGPSAQADSRTI